MNTLLWVFQGALAIVFAASGAMKSTLPKPRLIAIGQTGVTPFPLPLIRFTAYCELLGAVGVILPWLTNTAAVLTPLAAAGFAVVMVGAVASHAHLREPRNTAVTTLILLVAVTVSVARFAAL
jgi:uncharacterized membrane protein YphA (DoxX/SURF4 family)